MTTIVKSYSIPEGTAVHVSRPAGPVAVRTYLLGFEDKYAGATTVLSKFSCDHELIDVEDVPAVLRRPDSRMVVFGDRWARRRDLLGRDLSGRHGQDPSRRAANTDVLHICDNLSPGMTQFGRYPPVEYGTTAEKTSLMERMLAMFYANYVDVHVGPGRTPAAGGYTVTCTVSNGRYNGYAFYPNNRSLLGSQEGTPDIVYPALRSYLVERMVAHNNEFAATGFVLSIADVEHVFSTIQGFSGIVAEYVAKYDTNEKWGILYGVMVERPKRRTRVLGRDRRPTATRPTEAPVAVETEPAVVTTPGPIEPPEQPVAPYPTWRSLYEGWKMLRTDVDMKFHEYVSIHLSEIGEPVDGLEALMREEKISPV